MKNSKKIFHRRMRALNKEREERRNKKDANVDNVKRIRSLWWEKTSGLKLPRNVNTLYEGIPPFSSQNSIFFASVDGNKSSLPA